MDHTQHKALQRATSRVFTRSALACAIGHITLGGAAVLTVVTLPSMALAQPAVAQARSYSIPPGTLEESLNRFGREAGILLSFTTETTVGLRSQGLQGSYAVQAGLDVLLAGSGLQATRQPKGSYLLSRVLAGTPVASEMGLPVVTVTASAERESAWGPVNGYVAKRSATGTKTDTPIIETPQSISVVTADRIEAIGATTLKDALGYTPGVSITTYGADSRYDWISVRGFDAYSPGFYLDGLPLRNIGTWGIWRTENYGTERLEILRGPASVLYGQSGPGGVVNVVSKRPTAEPFHEIQMQLGDHGHHQLAGDFSGSLDEDGTLLYRLTGFVRNADLPTGNMPDDRLYIAPSLTWRPSTDTSLTLLSHDSRTRAGTYTAAWPARGSLVPTAAGTHVPTSTYTGEPNFNRFEQDQWAVGYLFEHRFDETWTVRQNARYGQLDVDYRGVSGSNFIAVNGDATDPANYRTIDRSVFASREHVKAFTLDNQVQGKLQLGEWQHTVLVGLDYQRSRFDQVTANGSAPSLDIYSPDYGQAVTIPDPYADAVSTVAQTGLYLQDQIKWERWVATLGGRYDHATSTVDDRLSGTTTRIPDHKFTSRAGLVYLHPSGLAPYLSYSESFVPTATIDPATGSPLKPETGRQYEAGIRYQPPGRTDSYSVAIFDLRRQNYITYDATTYMPKQTGEVLVRGLELEATIQPVSRLNLTGSYAWTPKADVTASINASEIGKQLTAVPEHKLSLWADYRFLDGIKVGVGARYTGSNRGDGETAPAEVPAYTVFDAMVGYDFEHWSLALNVRNIGDKTYIANCAYSSCYYGDPRKAIATATYRW